MTSKVVKKPKAVLGRPALKPGSPKRSSFNTRLRAETKESLEAEAAKSGRSLSEEIEFRLEQSLRDEAALGSAELSALFRMLGAAANLIEARTGKSCMADHMTSIAVRAAWKKLIAEASPLPGEEWKDALGMYPEDELPPPPKIRNPTDFPSLLSESAYTLVEPEDFGAAQAEFEKKKAALESSQKDFLRQLGELVDEGNRSEILGEDVAMGLFPPRAEK